MGEKRSVRKVPEANVVAISTIKGLWMGVKLIASYTPSWLWLIVVLIGILRFTSRVKSKRG
jgi:hypothetical protein